MLQSGFDSTTLYIITTLRSITTFVSQNVNIFANAVGFTPSSTEDEIIPFSSIISHEGTVLYGNGSNVPEDKRLRLEIFYTEPINN